MAESWVKRYTARAARSRLASQLGAFVIIVIAIMEAIRIGQGAMAAENLSWVSVWRGVIPTTVFFLVFGLRFFLLVRFASNFVIRFFTWWSVFITGWICYSIFGPEPGVVYDLFSTFPLETSWLVFVLFGCLRFLYFALASFGYDIDSNN